MCKFPPQYRKLTPAQKLAWLKSDECRKLIITRVLQQSQVNGEEVQIRRKFDRISNMVPSKPWMEAHKRGEEFPPPAENTPMVKARTMLHTDEESVLWPAHYVSIDGTLYDVTCAETQALSDQLGLEEEAHWGMSIFERSHGIKSTNFKPHCRQQFTYAEGRVLPVQQIALKSENVHVLKQEIARHLAKADGEEIQRYGRVKVAVERCKQKKSA